MKHLKLAVIFILPLFNGLKAQSWWVEELERRADDLTRHEREFVRGALNYGEPSKRNHPYTMFNKNRYPGFHWTRDLIIKKLDFASAAALRQLGQPKLNLLY